MLLLADFAGLVKPARDFGVEGFDFKSAIENLKS